MAQWQRRCNRTKSSTHAATQSSSDSPLEVSSAVSQIRHNFHYCLLAILMWLMGFESTGGVSIHAGDSISSTCHAVMQRPLEMLSARSIAQQIRDLKQEVLNLGQVVRISSPLTRTLQVTLKTGSECIIYVKSNAIGYHATWSPYFSPSSSSAVATKPPRALVIPCCSIVPSLLASSHNAPRDSVKPVPTRRTASTSVQNSCRHLVHLRPTARSTLLGSNPLVCPLLICPR